MSETDVEIADVVRVEGRRVLATLTRTFGSLELAEDAVQEAVLTALERWPESGVPEEPRAWLTVVARRKALDVVRREQRRGTKERAGTQLLFSGESVPPPDSVVRDDQLRLIFTCCHPALAIDARVALSLRTLCGLTTGEIGRALLVPEATMAKRLVRAKQKIAAAGIPYRVPTPDELPERLPAVLAVVYLVFTEGHMATSGDALVRVDLCDEAIRLARLLVELLPDESEVQALLALLLLTDARRDTRVDAHGELVLLADQDRARWDHSAIAEAGEHLDHATALAASPGPYLLQARIARHHDTAPSFDATDWAAIAADYAELDRIQPSSVIRLNRAVAVAEAEGPAAGLALVEPLTDLGRFHRWHATRGELLRRLGRDDDAAEAYRAALTCGPSATEQRHLEARLRELDHTPR